MYPETTQIARRNESAPGHTNAARGHSAATSAPGPDSPLPHLDRDKTDACRICTGTLGSPLHIWTLQRTGTGLTPAASARGLWAHPCHIRAGTWVQLTAELTRLTDEVDRLHREWADPHSKARAL